MLNGTNKQNYICTMLAIFFFAKRILINTVYLSNLCFSKLLRFISTPPEFWEQNILASRYPGNFLWLESLLLIQAVLREKMKPSDSAFKNIFLPYLMIFFPQALFSIYNDHILGSFSHQLFKIFSKGPLSY